MPNDTIPLPEYDIDTINLGLFRVRGYTTIAMHAHAAAVTREKDARIKVLEDALRGVMSGCKYSRIADEWHWHEKSMPTNAALNAARAALGDSAPTTPPPSPSPRS